MCVCVWRRVKRDCTGSPEHYTAAATLKTFNRHMVFYIIYNYDFSNIYELTEMTPFILISLKFLFFFIQINSQLSCRKIYFINASALQHEKIDIDPRVTKLRHAKLYR